MEKTADLAMIQKTNIDALHKEDKSQRVITERCGLGLPLTTIFISISLLTNLSINQLIWTILLKNILLNQIKSKFLWNPFLKPK